MLKAVVLDQGGETLRLRTTRYGTEALLLFRGRMLPFKARHVA